MEEAEVEQVHDGVFDTADVDIYRQPVVGRFRIQHSFLILRAGVARIVRGGFHKGVKVSVSRNAGWPLTVVLAHSGSALIGLVMPSMTTSSGRITGS